MTNRRSVWQAEHWRWCEIVSALLTTDTSRSENLDSLQGHRYLSAKPRHLLALGQRLNLNRYETKSLRIPTH
jgi:hypothetical protein